MPEAGDRPTLASTLTQLRDARGMKNAELARALHLSPSLLGRYLSGEVRPGVDHLAKIASYFGIDHEWLEQLAGYRANSSAAEQATVDPEVAALLDNDRAETLAMLEGIPAIFHVSIMNAQRDARKNVIQAIRDAVSQLSDTRLARPDNPRPNSHRKGKPASDDELSVREQMRSTVGILLTASPA